MARRITLFHLVVTVFAALVVNISFTPPAAQAQTADNFTDPADQARLEVLFDRLRGDGWRLAETEILQIWSRSGSAAMDLLLKRGIEALDAGEVEAALFHLTALTDHAPDFAEGWAARGAAHAMAGQFGPAAADLARALALEPRHFAALTLLCQMLDEMDRPDSAEAACAASLAIHPHQQEAIDTLSRLRHRSQGVLL